MTAATWTEKAELSIKIINITVIMIMMVLSIPINRTCFFLHWRGIIFQWLRHFASYGKIVKNMHKNAEQYVWARQQIPVVN